MSRLPAGTFNSVPFICRSGSAEPQTNPTEVAVVDTVADPSATYDAVRAVFPGNLCVVRAPHSRLQVNAVRNRLPGPTDPDWRQYQPNADYFRGQVEVTVTVMDEQRHRVLTAADRGTGIVHATAWLLPVR